MDYVLTRYKIQTGKLKEFEKAVADFYSDKNNILKSLEVAGIEFESTFIQTSKEGDSYFYVFKKVKDNKVVISTLKNPKLNADQKAVNLVSNFLEERLEFPALEVFDLKK